MQRQAVPFVLANCAHGSVILHRLDYRRLNETHNEFGVGTDILVHGAFDLDLISMTGGMLLARREKYGPGVVALDCGANIGVYTLEWARQMTDWGSVLAYEPQERIYYALCGNIALNNLFNARAFRRAIGARNAITTLPLLDYQKPGQFGGLRLDGSADVGQTATGSQSVAVQAIDTLGLDRVDFIKIDIEGMEPEALAGAWETIKRDQPYLLIEWHICGKEAIEKPLAALGYETVTVGMNLIAGPSGDEIIARIREFMAQAAPEAA